MNIDPFVMLQRRPTGRGYYKLGERGQRNTGRLIRLPGISLKRRLQPSLRALTVLPAFGFWYSDVIGGSKEQEKEGTKERSHYPTYWHYHLGQEFLHATGLQAVVQPQSKNSMI